MKRPPGSPTATLAGGAVRLAQQRDRAAVGIGDGVALLLPAVAGQRLLEVARAVEQADGDDRHAEVAGGLQVVAGEDAEAAGVLRQRGGDAVLGREVGDARGRVGAERLEPAVGGRGSSRRSSRLRLTQSTKPGVGRQLGEPLRRHLAEQAHRVLAAGVPQLGVDGREQVAGRGVPGPAQVDGELLERGEVLGQDGADGESSNRSHGAHASGWNRAGNTTRGGDSSM